MYYILCIANLLMLLVLIKTRMEIKDLQCFLFGVPEKDKDYKNYKDYNNKD